MKTITKSKPPNKIKKQVEIEMIYQQITAVAIDELKQWKEPCQSTYCLLDHSKNEFPTNLMKEFLCYFWNITLQTSPRKSKPYILIDVGKEGLDRYGKEHFRSFITKCHNVLQSQIQHDTEENWLNLNDSPIPMLYYYLSVIARGETESVSIFNAN
jgi:hypothetical protein